MRRSSSGGTRQVWAGVEDKQDSHIRSSFAHSSLVQQIIHPSSPKHQIVMADKVINDDKLGAEEVVVGVEWDEDRKKLDRRINRKLDMRIMPWLIVRSVPRQSG